MQKCKEEEEYVNADRKNASNNKINTLAPALGCYEFQRNRSCRIKDAVITLTNEEERKWLWVILANQQIKRSHNSLSLVM